MEGAGELLGREPALAMARSALDQAIGGAGRLLLVAGDPGIGKTAFARTILAHAAARGCATSWAACWPGNGAPEYWPWMQLLRDAAAGVPQGDLGPAARLIAGATSAPEAIHETTAASERFELFQAIVDVLTLLSRQRPAVLVIDDLHWADSASIDLLDFVARRLPGCPMLLVGTYRDLDAPTGLRRLSSSADGLALGGVDESAVRGIITTITGAQPSAELAGDVWQRTGGNPLFVRELCRLIVTRGVGGDTGSPAALLPDTVRGTLEQRLAHVSAQCRSLLRAAAVLDAPASNVLEAMRVAHVQAKAARALIDEAIRARILVADADHVQFTHDLFRQTVLASMDDAEMRRLHGAAADALAKLRVTSQAVTASAVAAHYVASGQNMPDALHWSLLAAGEATGRLAHAEACRHLRDALRVMREGSAVAEASEQALILDLAHAQARAGFPDARHTYVSAVAAARAADDAVTLGNAVLGIHRLGARATAEHEQVIALLREALDVQPVRGALRARLLAALARELRHSDHPAAVAAKPAEEAVAAARSLGDPSTLAICLLALHDARWEPGTARARLAFIQEMAEAAFAAADVELTAQAVQLRAACLLELNERAGRAVLHEYCTVAAALGHAQGRWEALSRGGTEALIDGRLDVALRLAAEARALGREMGLPDADGVHGTLAWQVARLHGTRHALIGEMLALDSIPQAAGFEAAAYADAGDDAGARNAAARLTVANLPEQHHDLEFSALLAEGIAAGGTEDQRRIMYSRLLPYAGTNIVVGGCASFWGPVDLFLGLLAAARGDRNAAERHLEAARAMAEHLGASGYAALAARTLTTLAGTTPPVNAFTREGDVWRLRFDGTTVHVPDSKGIQDIALLIGRSGDDVAAFQLYTGTPVAGGADQMLDARAKEEYRGRLAELDLEIDEAAASNDPYRAERAGVERDALIAALKDAIGLGGRDRHLGDERERARKAVTGRIREAIARIARVHPALARHLNESVTTGLWCSYRPALQTNWEL